MCFHITMDLPNLSHPCLTSCPRILELGRTQVWVLKGKGLQRGPPRSNDKPVPRCENLLVCPHASTKGLTQGRGLHIQPHVTWVTLPAHYTVEFLDIQKHSFPPLSLIPVNLRHCPKAAGTSATSHAGTGKWGDSGAAAPHVGQKRHFLTSTTIC